MDNPSLKRISKKLSYALRHKPEAFGITLDAQGWTDVSGVLTGFNASGNPVSLEDLVEVVENNNKQRFEFNDDQTRIRARQGHSVDVDLGYAPSQPPEQLYHGTPAKNVKGIQASGLLKGSRHHVHLSSDIETAKIVARRHGVDWVIFEVASAAMARLTKAEFFCTGNNVWLTETVPPAFLFVHSMADD